MNYRQKLIWIATFLSGLYFILQFFVPEFYSIIRISSFSDQILDGFIAIGAVAFGLGIINLIIIHGSTIIFKRKNWIFSFTLIISLLTTIFVNSMDWWLDAKSVEISSKGVLLAEFAKDIKSRTNDHSVPRREDRLSVLNIETNNWLKSADFKLNSLKINTSEELVVLDNKILNELKLVENEPENDEVLLSLSLAISSRASMQGKLERGVNERSIFKHLKTILFDGFFVSLSSAIFSLLAVYIAAAAYRALRIRSFEAGLMMLAALIVIIGQTPFGMGYMPLLVEIRQWLLDVPSKATFRAIRFGALVASLVMMIRMWLSLDKDTRDI